MSTFLHLNLLKDEERYSPSPVRLRVMVPMLGLLAALGCLVWWALLGLSEHNQSSIIANVQKNIQELRAAHSAVLALRSQEKEIASNIRQLRFYEHSRLRFGGTLTQFSAHVPPNIQLAEMRVLPPPPPCVDPKKPELGPTNTAEYVTLRLSGRTSGDQASAAVNALLAALRTPAFTNLIKTAEIPKGSFRQDVVFNPANRDTLLFEISCECGPRRFE